MKILNKKIHTSIKKGITLTELLVASILIGIVMIGVASFSVSIQQLQNSTNRSTILAMKTTAAMNRLTRDAYLAVGDETNRGIVNKLIPPRESVCFRHDTNDPSSYADDTWTCYFFESALDKRRLSLCPVPTAEADVPPNNTGKCDGTGQRSLLLTLNPAQGNFHQIIEDSDGRLESIEITLSAIYDPTLAPHPITNPTYTATTQVSPPGHSR